ncbi:MAG: DNA-processing protein DprA [Bacteroidota bacterium]
MDEAALYHLALLKVPAVGHSTLKTLISYCGSAEAVFKTPVGKLLRIPGVGETIARGIHQTDPHQAAQEEFSKAEKAEVSILTHTAKEYPSRLKQIVDAPALLYVKGHPPLSAPKSIGIVGTRKATDYGRQITQRIVQELVPYQPLIVSGLAYGIDIEAHRAALQAGLPTVGVMASGIDLVYPAAHKNSAQRMVESGGGLVTEYPFGSKPDAPKFPARNRIIAGMVDALVVVEAAESGGALITAYLAQEYDRDIFAVPGNLNQPFSVGCLQLIRKQVAQVFTSVAELAEALHWTAGEEPAAVPLDISQFSTPAQQLLKHLQEQPEGVLLDELSWKSQIPVNQVLSLLLELEFQGVVKPLPGKRYRMEG